MGLTPVHGPAHRRADARSSTHRHHRHAHRRVTAIGAKYLARKGSKVLGHIGARGTAYWNVRLLDSSLRLRRDPRPFAPARKPRRLWRKLSADLGKRVVVTEDWRAASRAPTSSSRPRA
jgi:ribosomal protein L3